MVAGAMDMSLETLGRRIPPNTEAHSESLPIEYHKPDETLCYEERRTQYHEGKFRNLTDYISQSVCVVTPEGQGAHFNPYWETYTGLSEEQSLDFGWMQAFHREDLDSFIKLLRRPSEAGAWEFEARLRRASDGSYRRHLCRCSVIASHPDGLINLLICFTDVEEWRNAEASSKEQGAILALSVRGHDQERRKIAHGLHDSAGQYLVALQMKLDGLQRRSLGNTGCENPIVDECRELVKRCCKEIRAISHLLYPPLLDDLGLESAVRLHVDGFMERNKAGVDLDVEPNLGRLDRDLEIALFRVVQEALASIHRQGAGKNLHIRIGAGQTSVFVEVAGVEVAGSGGTEPWPDKITASTRTPSGVGMATVRQRILEMGGLFEIGPLPSGMVIRAVVPRRALVAQAGD